MRIKLSKIGKLWIYRLFHKTSGAIQVCIKNQTKKPTHAGGLIGAFVLQVDVALVASHPVKKLS
jgi:hypothetical protein